MKNSDTIDIGSLDLRNLERSAKIDFWQPLNMAKVKIAFRGSLDVFQQENHAALDERWRQEAPAVEHELETSFEVQQKKTMKAQTIKIMITRSLRTDG